MSFSRTDLIDKVLENLGVLAAGQTAEVEDTDKIDGRLDGIIATLRATEVFYQGDADNISDASFLPLANVAAYECRTPFGVTGDDLVALKNANDEAIVKLKIISRSRPTYAPLKTEYF